MDKVEVIMHREKGLILYRAVAVQVGEFECRTGAPIVCLDDEIVIRVKGKFSLSKFTLELGDVDE